MWSDVPVNDLKNEGYYIGVGYNNGANWTSLLAIAIWSDATNSFDTWPGFKLVNRCF